MSETSTPPPSTDPGDPGNILLHPSGGRSVPARWTPLDTIMGIGVLIAAAALGGAIIGPITGYDGLDATLAGQLLFGAALIGSAALVVAQRAPGASVVMQLGLAAPRGWAWLGYTVLALIAYLLVALAYSRVVEVPDQTQLVEELDLTASTLSAVIVGILVIGVAPFAEEVFFRGFLFQGLRSRMSFLAAAVLSGAIFGSVHLVTTEPVAVIQLALLGMILAWLYERTGSLWAPIALHTFNNVLAFLTLLELAN